ncbi:Hypothetical predicted protein [Pelobates cultripes]|uniref:Uncharacterized protein n=1 Tax=Pelobates cultripes TaxID=61616 RepID=A0AAD1TPZ8_PELCU|nr:Hypothetical predicted protein [Pelobates cultripes]
MTTRKGQDKQPMKRERNIECKSDRRLSSSAPLQTQKLELDQQQNLSDSSSQSFKEAEHLSPKDISSNLSPKEYSADELHIYLESCFERQLEKIKKEIHDGLLEFKMELSQMGNKLKQYEEKEESMEFQQATTEDTMRKTNKKIEDM